MRISDWSSDVCSSDLFVAPSEVQGVAERFGAASFDIEVEGIVWSHRDELCTFDVMVDAFGLGGHEPLKRLAPIVRGADTGRPDLVPEAAGLLEIGRASCRERVCKYV